MWTFFHGGCHEEKEGQCGSSGVLINFGLVIVFNAHRPLI
jgi:hypothetical protein